MLNTSEQFRITRLHSPGMHLDDGLRSSIISSSGLGGLRLGLPSLFLWSSLSSGTGPAGELGGFASASLSSSSEDEDEEDEDEEEVLGTLTSSSMSTAAASSSSSSSSSSELNSNSEESSLSAEESELALEESELSSFAKNKKQMMNYRK